MVKEKAKKVELVAKNGTKASDITMQYMYDYCTDIGDADALDWFIEITERKVEYDKYPLSDAPVPLQHKPALLPVLHLATAPLHQYPAAP